MGPNKPPLSISEELVDDSSRRAMFARLRERYAEARELLIFPTPAPTASHEHLEWILGTRRNLKLDESVLDGRISELVVLWLEDLALDLEALHWAEPPPDPAALVAPEAVARQQLVESLRAATRDFATSLLAPPGKSASES